jgi:hypothetical protein
VISNQSQSSTKLLAVVYPVVLKDLQQYGMQKEQLEIGS